MVVSVVVSVRPLMGDGSVPGAVPHPRGVHYRHGSSARMTSLDAAAISRLLYALDAELADRDTAVDL